MDIQLSKEQIETFETIRDLLWFYSREYFRAEPLLPSLPKQERLNVYCKKRRRKKLSKVSKMERDKLRKFTRILALVEELDVPLRTFIHVQVRALATIQPTTLPRLGNLSSELSKSRFHQFSTEKERSIGADGKRKQLESKEPEVKYLIAASVKLLLRRLCLIMEEQGQVPPLHVVIEELRLLLSSRRISKLYLLVSPVVEHDLELRKERIKLSERVSKKTIEEIESATKSLELENELNDTKVKELLQYVI